VDIYEVNLTKAGQQFIAYIDMMREVRPGDLRSNSLRAMSM